MAEIIGQPATKVITTKRFVRSVEIDLPLPGQGTITARAKFVKVAVDEDNNVVGSPVADGEHTLTEVELQAYVGFPQVYSWLHDQFHAGRTAQDVVPEPEEPTGAPTD